MRLYLPCVLGANIAGGEQSVNFAAGPIRREIVNCLEMEERKLNISEPKMEASEVKLYFKNKCFNLTTSVSIKQQVFQSNNKCLNLTTSVLI